jgi:2-oxoglutarate ferredoxin oxidoreductase subunit beta
VTFNKINTYEWYRKRVYHLETDYNPEDRIEAFRKALEWGDRIPTGIIYKNNRPTLEDRIPVIKEDPLIKQPFDITKIETTLKEFY